MNFTKEKIDIYAEKLLIGLTDDENKLVLEEFEMIDNQINIINQIKGIENVEPMSFALDNFSYSLRDDNTENNITIEEALKNCGNISGREVEIPKVVNKDESNE